MSKTTWTSGPWEVGTRRPYIIATTRPESNRCRPSHVVSAGEPTGGNGWPDAQNEEGDYTPEAMLANARLIAAAPTLYKALEEILMVGNPSGTSPEAYRLLVAAHEKGRAALAAAKGGTQ